MKKINIILFFIVSFFVFQFHNYNHHSINNDCIDGILCIQYNINSKLLFSLSFIAFGLSISYIFIQLFKNHIVFHSIRICNIFSIRSPPLYFY